MADRSQVEAFLEAYRAGFEALEVEALVDPFSYPCVVTTDATAVAVTIVPSREAWIPQLERLVDAYRALAVRSPEVVILQVSELTPRLAQATVRWTLVDATGARIYDFDASYTLADLGDGMRITAIAHNEAALLRAAVARERREN